MLNVDKIREDFPQINHLYDGKNIIYMDNAATTLKPQVVIDALDKYNGEETANVHRGIHTLSEISTHKYENTRDELVKFLNAASREEIIFTKGTTESINLVAKTYGVANLKTDDEVLISTLEHHSNIVPWQMLCELTGAKLKIIEVTDEGQISFESLSRELSSKTKLVSVNYVSNALGTINDVAAIIKKVRSLSDAVIHIDAAQAIPHIKVDVQKLDCDFLSMSAHKMFAPTGVGLLYGKQKLLEAMPPFMGGGDMIDEVRFEKTTYNKLPYKFEAGTPNIANVIAWQEALHYLNALNVEDIVAYEKELLQYGSRRLKEVPGLRIIGDHEHKAPIFSFVMDGLHPHDIATMLNKYNIAIRTGHHCTQPLMRRMKVSATARASLSIYNTKAEIDQLVAALKEIQEMFC